MDKFVKGFFGVWRYDNGVNTHRRQRRQYGNAIDDYDNSEINQMNDVSFIDMYNLNYNALETRSVLSQPDIKRFNPTVLCFMIKSRTSMCFIWWNQNAVIWFTSIFTLKLCLHMFVIGYDFYKINYTL